ncbi:hypothetical protein AVEN_214089-1 [Araneus ventricosus]|uniref:Uncharacterized protein n=1 Tax=Araneus ventricosus TaxID=182803 RepID=A0A4Y2C759_ARAVE|nr:hypothetical protein AVEN_214089-1 [Araneus ventricosus]
MKNTWKSFSLDSFPVWEDIDDGFFRFGAYFLWNKLEKDIVLVQKGLESIIQASLRVEDGLHERLREKTKITAHKSCRQKYTRLSSIRASTKQKETSESSPTTSSVLRSSEEKFDFKNDCFILGKPTVVDSKYPLHRRKPVHFVFTLKIRILCHERCDDLGERVKCDLVAPEARCHKYCYREFLRTTLRKDTVGRPKSEVFDKLCNTSKVAMDANLLYKNYRV